MNNDSTNLTLQEKSPEITIDLIDVPGKNPRGLMNDDHVIELSGNIARNGLLEPIGLVKKVNGRYELIYGFHRLAAILRLGWKKIPATIREGNGTPTKILSLCENLIRKEMSLQEEIEAVGLLTREEHLSPSMICDFLNRSRSWVDRRLAAPGLPQKIKDALFEGLIDLSKAELIASMPEEGMRNVILNQVIYGKLTTSQTKELTEMYITNPTLETAIQEGIKQTQEIQAPSQILRPCTLCGTMREATRIVYIPVCSGGCKKQQQQQPEEVK